MRYRKFEINKHGSVWMLKMLIASDRHEDLICENFTDSELDDLVKVIQDRKG